MKKALLFVLAIISIFTFSITVFAEREKTDEEKKEIARSIGFHLIDKEKCEAAIVSIDINENGDILFADSQYHVYVADRDGNIKYAYSFYVHGSYYAKWDNGNILMCFVRGFFFCKYDIYGNYLELYGSDYDDPVFKEVKKTTRTFDGVTYKITNQSAFFDTFSAGMFRKLVRINVDGSEETLIDTTTSNFVWKITLGVVAAILLGCCIVFRVLALVLKPSKRIMLAINVFSAISVVIFFIIIAFIVLR